MPGNLGPWKLAPGQGTDDTEMTMALLTGLGKQTKGRLDTLTLSREYVYWFKSKPFDIGGTTRRAMIGA